MTYIRLGFHLDPLEVPVEQILPTRKTPPNLRSTAKFRQICASIKEVGLIEPLAISPTNGTARQYILLDGHIRLIALQDQGHAKVSCLMATDDESYSFNNRLNRLSSLQEHLMIRRAIERGVTPERIANALAVDVRSIRFKSKLAEGLCPEAIELLKDAQFSVEVPRSLRQMKPARQIECIELMVAANRITSRYARALLLTTPPELLVEPKKPPRTSISREKLTKMEREMANLQGRYRLAETSYGKDILDLVLARGYVEKLLANKSVFRYLQQFHPDVLHEFEAIVRLASLEQ